MASIARFRSTSELHALDDVGVHVRGVGAVAALALGLRPVHGEVRVAQERFGVLGAGGDADACADVDLAPLDRDRFNEGLEDAARGHGRVGVVLDLLDQYGELVTAQARDRVGGPQAPLQTGCDGLEQLVARPVPERVIDGLEVVEVDEENADRTANARSAADGEREAVEEERAVRHAGERVVECLVRDVVECPCVVDRQARVLGQREERLLIARRVGAIAIFGGGHDAADDGRALKHRGSHAGVKALGAPQVGNLAVERVGGLVDDDEASFLHGPYAEARIARAAPCGQELGAEADRRDDGRAIARVRVSHSHHAGAVADQLARGADDLVEDVVKGLLGDDRALDRREALEHHLAIAKRLEEAGVLGRLALGFRSHPALVVDEAERPAAERDDAAQPADQVPLGAGELRLGADDDKDAPIAPRLGVQRIGGLFAQANRAPAPGGGSAYVRDVDRVGLGPAARITSFRSTRAAASATRTSTARSTSRIVAERSSSNELTSIRKSASWRVDQPSESGSCVASVISGEPDRRFARME